MKQKNYNLELARIFSFVMVIAIHAANYYCRKYAAISSGEYLFSLFINVISRVSVPCFFMLSGALLLGRKDSVPKSLGRAADMFKKLVFWSIVYYVFNTYITRQDTFALSNFWYKQAEAHLWYLYVLIPIYIMLPFLQLISNGLDEKLEKAFVIIGGIWLIGLYIILFLGKSFYYDLPILGNRSYIYYFFIGYLIRKNKNRIQIKTKHLFTIFAACCLLIFIATAFASFGKNMHYDSYLKYGNPLMAAASIAFFAMFMCLKPEALKLTDKKKKIIDEWSACSFGIYIVHIFFLDLYKINFSVTDVPAYLAIPMLVFLMVVLSFVFVKILKRIPFLQKLI